VSSVLIAKELGRWYGQVVGLNELTVDVGGGITGLIGPNGAGKSTFLKLIAGEIRPSRGSIRVLGEDPFANRELKRRVGFCPQQDSLYDDMTALEILTLLLRLSGFDSGEAEDRAVAALKRVSLEGDMRRRTGGYSKGMRQRVKLAQAIAHDPELLVLDEPMTGLDPIGRRDLLDLLRELGEDGRSILISSHVLHEVESLTENILLLHRGRLLAQGTVPEVRGLLSKHPSRIELSARRPRELARELIRYDEVVSVRLAWENGHSDNGRIDLETRDAEAFFRRLTRVAADGGYGIESLASADASLEAIFDYLVN
jgi:ABC-2 type transport system ATP-binding protein